MGMDAFGGNARYEVAIDDAVVADVDADAGGSEPMFDLHVRAYNHWVSLLKGRPYPSIEDLDPQSIVDFGGNSVLLDFSDGLDDPRIAFLGRALKEECGLEGQIDRIGAVPSRRSSPTTRRSASRRSSSASADARRCIAAS